MFAPVEYLTYEIRGVSDIKSFVGVDAHIDPLLLAFSRARRGGRPCAAVSAVRRATDAAHPLRVLSARFHRRVFRLPRRAF